MNEQDVDRELRAAGQRLRATGPDASATRAAYARREHAQPNRRPMWPAIMAGGLVAAAIVGIVTVGTIDRSDPTVTPTEERPPAVTSISVPSSLPAAPTTLAEPPSGSVVAVEPTVTEPSADATPCSAMADATGVRGLIVEVVACRRWNGGEQAIVRRYADGDPVSATYAVSGDWSLTGGTGDVELFGPIVIEGLDGVLAFRASLPDVGAECLLFVSGDPNGWRESCGAFGTRTTVSSVITGINGSLVQIEADADSLRGAVLSEMWPSSGCTLDDAKGMYLAAVGPSFGSDGSPTVVLTSIGCVGDRASATESSVFLQPGPVDGGIILFDRSPDGWVVADSGTGIEPLTDGAIPPLIP